MKWMIIPPILMGCGLLLILAGFVWPRAVGRAGWSEEQAERRSTAGADVHRLQYQYAAAAEPETDNGGVGRGARPLNEGDRANADRIKAELDRAHEEWDRADLELKAARARRSVPAFVFWLLGIVSCLVGVAAHFVLRTEWAQQLVDV